jgi:membrane-bound inhibitor of C-type lysozyme
LLETRQTSTNYIKTSCKEYNLTVKYNNTWNKTTKIIVRDKQVPTISRLISASLLITHANEQQK